MWPNPQFPVDLLTFTEENPYWKTSLFYAVNFLLSESGRTLRELFWNVLKNGFLGQTVVYTAQKMKKSLMENFIFGAELKISNSFR